MILFPAFLVVLLAISTASAIPTQTRTQIQLSRRDSARVRSLHPRCARHCGPPGAAASLCTQRSDARGAAELGAGLDEGLLSAPSTATQLAAFSRVVPLDGFADGSVDVGVEPIEQEERNCGSSHGVPSPRSRQENKRASKDDGRRRERQRAQRAPLTRDDALARIARSLKGGAEASGSRHTLLTGPDETPSGARPHFDRASEGQVKAR